ncbi:hypothetical protein [Umezakia ovalisporum]|jgi:hypothetical protein|nr:hypothetical protein [Umezakia ovalisporum]MDH6058498.1 hypothetical protein [Umezakia ovalisporum FSS-43]MDH6069421.1 hypothetical protein [Umezakia ovalisporum CobakiLakeA]MDH6077567.1 hypothetical protein [Umezakia ovalisporum FSS-45]MDH6080156.1 hypothetical protein [Umezakia ovalisporum FSS-44]MDH6096807.1 hypothetical protein [Umezakia ovalisporum CobakiLakeB]
MSIWIVTTGNSDIILKHDNSWGRLHNEAITNNKLQSWHFSSALPIEKGYTVPARILGTVYENQSEEDYENDLDFPLLDTYCKYLRKNNVKLDKVIILLTDQSQIFSNEEQRLNEKSPYWKDTCNLEPLLRWYFINSNFNCKLEFQTLSPDKINQGIDNWDATLSLVEAKLAELNLNIDGSQEVYVSHQAGTPATSSAVQFVTIGKFKKVQFLVSNEYFNEDYELKSKSDIVEISRYQRAMQIQKAKQLIISGFPGAALKILEDIQVVDETCIVQLKNLVDFFNLNTPLIDESEDLTVISATQRIVNTLDLIGFFFNQKNYLPGIALLAAAQETFLKVAILSQIAMINETINFQGKSCKVSDLIAWVPLGLYLDKSVESATISIKKNILGKLKFPVNQFWLECEEDFKVTNKNYALLYWLKNLETQFSQLSWNLLKWSCHKKRNGDDDVRNQLMHNLRGVEDYEVIDYLLGYEEHQLTDVMTVYNNHVKQPFLKAIDFFKLPYKREKLTKKLQQIADSIT